MKKEFQDIFAHSFDTDAAWRRWFFGEVVEEEQIRLASDAKGRAASALLLQPFDFLFHKERVPSMYMSCVGTRPEARSKGLASHLIVDSLIEMRESGTVFCQLIPASDHLYFFYDHFGFATVFYVDRERYTAVHPFDGGKGEAVEPTFELFSRLEAQRACGPQHSEADFRHAMEDVALDKGWTLASADEEGHGAILFATPSDDGVHVKSLLADDETVRLAVLAQLRTKVGEKSIAVDGPPLSGEKAFLRSFGMLRVTDAMGALTALARAYPHLRQTIRLRDELIEANSGTYELRDGHCQRTESEKASLEVDVGTLAALLFGSSKMGEVFDLPSRRPYMALMLE